MELDPTWLTTVSVLLGGLVFVLGFLRKFNELYYAARFGRNSEHPLPPGDMGWPLLGNLLTFLRAFKSTDPDSFVSDMASRHGKTGIYKSHLFGHPSVIVCSPEMCRRAMTDEASFKIGYPRSTDILMGRRVFHNVSAAEHKRLRRITTSPINGHEALSMYIPCIERIVVDHLRLWSSSASPIELVVELRKATFKVINTIFMGPTSDSDVDAVGELYSDLLTGLRSMVIDLPGFAFRRALQARKKLVKILQKVLDNKRISCEGDENKRDMIDLLMAVKDEEGTQLEDEDIVDLLLLFMLAGHESSAHSALWVIIYLTQNPHILAKAKEEQIEIMKRRPSTQEGLTLQEIKQMTYLYKVIDETLRKVSLNFANFRQAKVDVQMNGYTIPKGWKVLVWNREAHMDPEAYKNPDEFDPERWENKPRPGSYLPFGLGSRLCPGADLAKLEVAIFLHHFLLSYKVEIMNPTSPIQYLPVPRPSDNCLARVIKIDP